MNTREKVLKEALNCVNGEREKQYGNPEDNFKRIADLWSVYLTSIFEDVVFELNPIDVAKMMILFKIARSNGDKDKMDNYVDMIGYAACAAEIFENGEEHPTAQPCDHVEVADECRVCDYSEKCMGTGVCLKKKEKECIKDKHNNAKQDTFYYGYSYFHDKLANYVSAKAKEEHVPLENLKDIDRKLPRELEELLDQEATDCVINGKKLIDCYKEIDELFKNFIPARLPIADFVKPDVKACNSSWEAYANVSDYITSSSRKANVNPVDVVNCLTRNGHAPTAMASLLLIGKLNSDAVDSYIEKAINEVKKENSK